MESKSYSEPPRRSERLKQKKTVGETTLTSTKTSQKQGSEQGVTAIQKRIGATISPSVVSSQVSQVRIAEIEHEIRKKEFELKKQQELMDLQLALKLAQIEGGVPTENEVLSIRESDNPNFEKWLKGKNPWNGENENLKCQNLNNSKRDVSSHSLNQFSNDNFSIISANDEAIPTPNKVDITLPQISQLLVRQSIPKDLPIFDGNPIDWPNFIQQYRNSNQICNFSNVENQIRLQRCLKGQARRVCQSLLIMPQNVEKVISLLQSRFGRSEHIVTLLTSKLRQFTNLRTEQVDQLVEFADEVNNFVDTIQSVNELEHLHNPMLLHELVEKLPMSYKVQWIEHVDRTRPKIKLLEFAKFLVRKSDTLCQLQKPSLIDSDRNDKRYDKRPNQKFSSKNVKIVNTLSTRNNNDRKCICCSQPVHSLKKCNKFNSLSVDERWSFVTAKKVCFSCLLPFHHISMCRYKRNCGINNCDKSHHELLHKNEEGSDATTNSQNIDSGENDIQNVATNCHVFDKQCVLLKILPVVLKYNNREVKTFALLDDASTITLIDKSLSDELQLSGSSHSLSIQWTNDEIVQRDDDSKVVSFTIQSDDRSRSFQLRHVHTIDLSLPSQSVDVENLQIKYPYLAGKVTSLNNAQPKLIIGQDNWPLLVNRKIITGPWNGPALSKTLLGWVVHGNVPTNRTDRQYLFYVGTNNIDETDHLPNLKDELDILHELIKDSWQVEEIIGAKTKPFSPEDNRATVIMQETMKRIGNRYETGLLWKDVNVVLPESKENAIRRLRSLEQKMDRNSEYGKTYCEKFEDLVKKKYIRKLSTEEAATQTDKTWYLPHFGTVNPNKPKKLRIVFDAAAKSNGVCLNDHLMTGPDLYNSLFTILINFRVKRYAFTADIREMFLQVQVRAEDRCAQRILWRGMDRQRDPDVYEIGVVFFGATCSPCLAQEAKNRNALEFANKYPDAVRDILESHYMDDYLGGTDSIEEAKRLIEEVIYVHEQGGFVICSWTANSQEILQNIDTDLLANTSKTLKLNEAVASEKILGVFWNTVEDTFEFQTRFHKINEDILNLKIRPTKRQILKVVMSIFDPLGFLANFTIQGKILLQDIWRTKLNWDDEITDVLFEKWKIWLNDLKKIYEFKVPRQYFTLDRNTSKIQLHIFCDASDKCYAAAAYLRVQSDNEIQVSFVCAKAKVASLKPISINRLELQAALMSARLGHSLRRELKIRLDNIFHWTDSKTVLHWIRAEARRFKVFVSQRIGEIQELTNVSDWRYVPTQLNVADEATKRVGNSNFHSKSRWWSGPEFLAELEENWCAEPYEERLFCNDPEIRTTDCILTIAKRQITKELLPEPSRFSKWWRLVRCTAYVRRFLKILKSKEKIGGELQVEELEEAETALLRQAQQDLFTEEFKVLSSNRSVPHSSKLFTLTPYLSDEGLIRLNGRLNNSQLNLSTTRPIILDAPHDITKLILRHYHEKYHHFGQETVINSIRQKFWIFKLRQRVRQTKSCCTYCRVRKAVPEVPLMGQLPKCRVEPTVRPFIRTGIDYFGPMLIKVKRTHEKRYGVIFTCMATRAIHLEIAYDLSTSEFINTLRRFGCRRGLPEEIYCDNGSNFRGADKELKKEFDKLNKDEIITYCALEKTKFMFNPALAPNMGGSWERLIRSIKTILKDMLKTKYPTESVLRTFLLECENIINSRPLTHVSMDTADAEALTPNHFLIGPKYTALPCAQTFESDLRLMSCWRAAQKLADHFWSRWTREYVPILIRRSKWHVDRRPIQLGEVVILVDPNGPRNNWQKGVVVKTYPAADGRIRVVDVRNSRGAILRRSVSKIIPIEIQE